MPDSLNTKRFHWLPRFRLRTLLILMCVLGAGLALGGNYWRRLKQQHSAIAQVERAGGEVFFAHEIELSDNSLVISYDSPPPGPGLLRRLLGENAFATVDYVKLRDHPEFSQIDPKLLRTFPSLRKLDLPADLHDDWLRQAAQLPQLRSIQISSASTWGPVKPISLGPLSQSRSLRSLDLLFKSLSADNLGEVAQLRQLTSLTFSVPHSASPSMLRQLTGPENLESLSIIAYQMDFGTLDITKFPRLRALKMMMGSFDQANLQAIGKLQHLEDLQLESIDFPKRDVSRLASLRRLRRLELYGTNVADSGVESLGSLLELRTLTLRGTQLTPAALARVSRFPELQDLNIYWVKGEASDDQLLQLQSLMKLQRLEIGPITPAQLAVLQKALPTCEIRGWAEDSRPLDP